MSIDLIKRLRSSDIGWEGAFYAAMEAAEVLEQQAARIAELEAANRKLDGQIEELREVADRAVALAETRKAEAERLRAIIDTPESNDFVKAILREAEHAAVRNAELDAGKTPFGWFKLVRWLSSKAVKAATREDAERERHHIITAAAACFNWHQARFGASAMQPGIEPPCSICNGSGWHDVGAPTSEADGHHPNLERCDCVAERAAESLAGGESK